jgi:hypothetical protein
VAYPITEHAASFSRPPFQPGFELGSCRCSTAVATDRVAFQVRSFAHSGSRIADCKGDAELQIRALGDSSVMRRMYDHVRQLVRCNVFPSSLCERNGYKGGKEGERRKVRRYQEEKGGLPKAHRPAPCPRRKHRGGRLRKPLLNKGFTSRMGS